MQCSRRWPTIGQSSLLWIIANYEAHKELFQAITTYIPNLNCYVIVSIMDCDHDLTCLHRNEEGVAHVVSVMYTPTFHVGFKSMGGV